MPSAAARAIIIQNGRLAVIKRNKFGDIYYVLVGGGVDPGETPDHALRREVEEETGMKVTSARLVYIEDGPPQFGRQHVYLCEASGDSMQIAEDTPEYELNKIGKNTYEPTWLSLGELRRVKFRSENLKNALIQGVKRGFPEDAERI